MTAVWGPLGWMTLHSVATSYSEAPAESEKQLMRSWLDLFRDTITCPSCRDHFTSLLANYRGQFPNMLNSRNDFATFSFRAHNDVNRRLHKPIYGSVVDCMETLRKNVESRSAQHFRMTYLDHISRHFRSFRDATGIAGLRKIQEMYKVENDYIAPRDTKFQATISEMNTVLASSILNRDPQDNIPRNAIPNSAQIGRFSLTGGGFRIRR
jgi:hypothetical protein